MITITDTHFIQIDGVDAGHVIDAVRNFPSRAAEIKGVYDVWFLNYTAAQQAAVYAKTQAAAKAAMDLELARGEFDVQKGQAEANSARLLTAAVAAVQTLQKTHEDLVRNLDAEHAAEVAKLELDVETLGTKPEAEEIRKAQRRKALEAELAALDAK